MNTRNLAASLLPVVFALASLGTVGCAADSETTDDVAARETPDAVAPATPALALAGSAGTPDVAAVAPSPDAQVGTAGGSMRLEVTDSAGKAVTYDVLEFDFGVDVGTLIGSATGGVSVSKPVLRPFNVVVRPNAKSALLAQDLNGAARLSTIVLQRVAADGTVSGIAQLEKPVVTRMLDVAAGSTRETYEIQTLALTAMDNGTSVTVDVSVNRTSCTSSTGGCPCTLPGTLGPYTQAGPLGSVPKGSTRIDRLNVELHNAVPVSASGGASASKPVLDGITFDAALETSGLCAMYYAGVGTHVPAVHLGVAGASKKGAPVVESTSWDACLAGVTGVGFSSVSATSPVREQVKLVAGGLVRTDRTIDVLTGAQTGKDLVTGWSFVENRQIAACQ
jgi:hypothetical protein